MTKRTFRSDLLGFRTLPEVQNTVALILKLEKYERSVNSTFPMLPPLLSQQDSGLTDFVERTLTGDFDLHKLQQLEQLTTVFHMKKMLATCLNP